MKRYAAFLGFTAVAILALGAHTLKNVLTPEQLESLTTAAYMQMFHAAVLLFLSHTLDRSNVFASRLLRTMSVGIGLFSFSIYLLLLNNFFYSITYNFLIVNMSSGRYLSTN